MKNYSGAEGSGRAALPLLRDIILSRLAEEGECQFGDLLALEEHDEGSVTEEVVILISDGLAYVAVPLSRLDWDTYVMPVDWSVGMSTITDIESGFGRAHRDMVINGAHTVTYDLYTEKVDHDDYPTPPAPHATRDEAERERPRNCTFPYAAIWPPEALQVEFTFGAAGTLTRFEFKVADRLT